VITLPPEQPIQRITLCRYADGSISLDTTPDMGREEYLELVGDGLNAMLIAEQEAQEQPQEYPMLIVIEGGKGKKKVKI